MPGIERSRRSKSGCKRATSVIAWRPSEAQPTTSKPCARRSDDSASRVSGWSSAMRIREAISFASSAAGLLPIRGRRRMDGRTGYQNWLWGEILLAGLLAAMLALFLSYPVLETSYDLPELRLVLQTTMALAGLLVAVLAAARYATEGRRVDLLLASGFFVTSLSSVVFAMGPR